MRETTSEKRGFLAEITICWLVSATVSIVMSAVAPQGIFREASLPPLSRLAVACTEPSALALVLFLLLGISAVLHRIAEARGWSRAAAAGKAWIAIAAGALVVGYSSSWACFWFTGQFLSFEAFEFFTSNARIMAGYLLHVHGLHLVGIIVLSPAAFLTVRGLHRRYIGFMSGAVLRRCVWLGGGLVVLMAAITLGIPRLDAVPAGVGDGAGGRTILAYHQAYQSGPTARLLAGLIRAGNERPPRVPGVRQGPSIARPPILSLEQYFATMEDPPKDPANVILILIDSLRADQLLAFGGSREVMPALEALAKESRCYKDCTTQAPHTDYAAPSAFSSQYPLRGPRVHHYSETALYPRIMIYDLLNAMGYRTALFSSQDERWGNMLSYLDTGGLDTVSHAGLDEVVAVRSSRWASEACRDDRDTIEAAIDWIDREQGTPFYLALNLQNAHSPYTVPQDFARPFGAGPEQGPRGFGRFSPEEAMRVKDVYADSLAYIDAQLDLFFRQLRNRGLLNRTLLVVTSDHGEAFHEHGLAAHSNGLFQELVWIPLLIRAPGLSPGTDDRPAELIDVAPSLLHLLGLPPHPGFQGKNLFAGEDGHDRCRYLVAHTPAAHQYAVIRSRMKLIYDARRGRASLFDLDDDPNERCNLAAVRADLTNELTALLTAWYEAQLDYYSDATRRRAEYPPVLTYRSR